MLLEFLGTLMMKIDVGVVDKQFWKVFGKLFI